MKRSKAIIVEEKFNLPKAKVWDAITRLEPMKQWFFENIEEFNPIAGFETQFNVKSGERDFLHQWRLVEVIPQIKIVYDWSYKGIPGRGFVSFELSDSSEATLLRLTNTGLESFPSDIPEFSRESCQAGWNYFIKDRLKTFLSEVSQ